MSYSRLAECEKYATWTRHRRATLKRLAFIGAVSRTIGVGEAGLQDPGLLLRELLPSQARWPFWQSRASRQLRGGHAFAVA